MYMSHYSKVHVPANEVEKRDADMRRKKRLIFLISMRPPIIRNFILIILFFSGTLIIFRY